MNILELLNAILNVLIEVEKEKQRAISQKILKIERVKRSELRNFVANLEAISEEYLESIEFAINDYYSISEKLTSFQKAIPKQKRNSFKKPIADIKKIDHQLNSLGYKIEEKIFRIKAELDQLNHHSIDFPIAHEILLRINSRGLMIDKKCYKSAS
ncbi:MAG: hypothetical protein KC478_16655 [Bacteriovoracaceae bacterium]|nr:hypothetical protein [Bacteriovoracaceae bacterium]